MALQDRRLCDKFVYGQRHAKRDLRTYAKSIDPDHPPRLGRPVWSESALFDTRYINGTNISCYVCNLITYSCFQQRVGADLGTHVQYVECPKVPFGVTLVILPITVYTVCVIGAGGDCGRATETGGHEQDPAG